MFIVLLNCYVWLLRLLLDFFSGFIIKALLDILLAVLLYTPFTLKPDLRSLWITTALPLQREVRGGLFEHLPSSELGWLFYCYMLYDWIGCCLPAVSVPRIPGQTTGWVSVSSWKWMALGTAWARPFRMRLHHWILSESMLCAPNSPQHHGDVPHDAPPP